MRPIWATRIWANPYKTQLESGCTPIGSNMGSPYGTHIGMFSGMYLYVHESVRYYTYYSENDFKSGLFLKPFLTFITYRLSLHLVENI